MNLISIRIIAKDVKQMADFYEQVVELPAVYYTDEFVEFNSRFATLAIGSVNTLKPFGGNELAQAAQNRSAIIEFLSPDVDADYQRLTGVFESQIVQKPTLMPWGNKSMLLRDPDGNLVNLFTPASPEAIRKFEEKI